MYVTQPPPPISPAGVAEPECHRCMCDVVVVTECGASELTVSNGVDIFCASASLLEKLATTRRLDEGGVGSVFRLNTTSVWFNLDWPLSVVGSTTGELSLLKYILNRLLHCLFTFYWFVGNLRENNNNLRTP